MEMLFVLGVVVLAVALTLLDDGPPRCPVCGKSRAHNADDGHIWGYMN